MTTIFKKNAQKYNISAWGTCSFSLVEKDLISCRAINDIPQNAQSILCVLFPYLLEDEMYENRNVSRYAVPKDYHDTAGTILQNAVNELEHAFPTNAFASFIDNSPLPEVKTALHCGLGVLGEHSLLIHETYGSYVFIGAIVTDLKVKHTVHESSHCTGCEKCKKACPTGAILHGGRIDKELCLSNITQKRGELVEWEEKAIEASGCVWGCDICQEVCPLNAKAAATPIKPFYENARAHVTLQDEITGYAYAWRGKTVLHRNLKLMNEL